eukprot:XP_011617885.1 PREDICTED: uncharacterized protein LOC101078822 [Takifugu rubripes]
MSAELLIAIAALLSWAVVGVVMFNFVEYKAVPDIQQIITDPVQAVNDAVDEVSSLLGKFQECAPDLSDPMSVATYAVEEIAEAKDAFVRHFSDEEGTFYLSYVDPVVIGRGIFHSTNAFVCETMGSFKDLLCGIVDAIVDTIGAVNKAPIDLSYIDPVVIGRQVFTVTNELVGGVVAYVQDAICTVINAVMDGVKGSVDVSFIDPVGLGRNAFTLIYDTVIGMKDYLQGLLCTMSDTIVDMTKGAPGVSFIDPVVIGRNIFSVTNDFVSGIAEYVQGVLSTVIDVILDTYQALLDVVGFSPTSALKRTVEVTTEEINNLLNYVSSALAGERAIVPEVSIDPMKIIEEAVLEFTDKKELLMAYMSSMIVGENYFKF